MVTWDKEAGMQRRERRFRIEIAWSETQDFLDLVKSIWENRNLLEKMEEYSRHIKWWRDNVFRNIPKKKQRCRAIQGI